MNGKEFVAFEKWWMDGFDYMSYEEIIKCKDIGKQSTLNGWQAACEYKQKEIDELKFQIMEIKGERNQAEFKLAVAVEALKHLSIGNNLSLSGRDALLKFIADREAVSNEALEKIKGKE